MAKRILILSHQLLTCLYFFCERDQRRPGHLSTVLSVMLRLMPY